MKQVIAVGFTMIAGAALPPVGGVLLIVSVLVNLWGASVLLSMFADGNVAPLLSSTIETAVFVVVSVSSYVLTRRRHALVRRRLEQHLAPPVVRRILETPGVLKLSGERREITALFTDIEGFTAMTCHANPAALLATLDGYFEGLATIIAAHGGMIDKIVGDAVHAFFNAPTDLENHPQKAIDCAIALFTWAETFRRSPEVAALGFGRTRIGIETGPAIVGDVGIHAKLDYTAHGDVVNLAARLEQANKEFGSSICIGPIAASHYDHSLLRPLGKVIVHGHVDAVAVFEPWRCVAPEGVPLVQPTALTISRSVKSTVGCLVRSR